MPNGLTLPYASPLYSGTMPNVAFTINASGCTAIEGNVDGPGVPGVWGSSQAGPGVLGVSRSAGYPAVLAQNLGGGYGVSASSLAGGGTGVYGEASGNGVHGRSASANDSGVWGENTGSGVGVAGNSSGGDGIHGTGSRNGVVGRTSSGSDSGVWADNTGAGAGVAGTSASGIGVYGRGGTFAGHFEGKVEVTGDLTAGNISGATVTCLNGLNTIGSVSHIGNVHVRGDVACDGDISLTHADCAEDFDVSGCEEVRPGTVMVINEEGNLIPSSHAYDRRVVGVVSGAGGLQPGIVLGRRSGSARTPIALIGKVYCQVDAGFSPIEVGDLLTTSSVQGHAMKATDPVRGFGAVIGKALRPMAQGRAIIPVLVALQ